MTAIPLIRDPVVRQLRAKAAAHVRHGNTEAAAESRRALGFIRLAREIRRIDAETPFTDEQRGALVLELTGGGDAGEA